MSDDIPGTHAAFKRWMADNQRNWPAELSDKAHVALLTLWTVENNPPAVLVQSKAFREMTEADLAAFAEAYRVWRAGNGAQ